MSGNSNPNTCGIIEFKKQQSEDKKNTVLGVLNKLSLLNDPINSPITKSEICRIAGVSRTFLFSYPEELIKPINDAIKQQTQKMRTALKTPSISESSKDKIIESLKRRIELLEETNRKLKSENTVLYGKLLKT